MNKTKLIFVGGIALGEIPTNGETAKNQVMLQRFEELFDKVYVIDSFYWRRNPFLLIKMIWYFFFIRNAKVIVSCHRSGMPVLNFLHRIRCQRHVYYWAIGSGLMDWIREGYVSIAACRFMKKIVAESPSMVKELEGMGLDNVVYMPNMKPIIRIENHKKSGKCNFVFLSRIIEEKGCNLILDSSRVLNDRGLNDKFSITFYGDVSEDPSFIERIKDYPNVQYKGILDLTTKTGYDELSSYNVFLFPTYYPNEGFPGVLMDALMSGLPIIATNWNYNLDVVENGYNGIVIKPNDLSALITAMYDVINEKYDLVKMAANCKESVKKYDVNNVLTEDRLKKLELI